MAGLRVQVRGDETEKIGGGVEREKMMTMNGGKVKVVVGNGSLSGVYIGATNGENLEGLGRWDKWGGDGVEEKTEAGRLVVVGLVELMVEG